ncbi:hypothetical protein [Pseudonocardia sp. GCM10023141]|uniref:hypothetical protein n=1 Tax=Pseudonocardia sp. GCM10023141 TaxID=3252653 RepID=UPI00361A01E7
MSDDLDSIDVPGPGSAAAVDQGCLCPVLINGPSTPANQLLTAPDCPMHTERLEPR